MYNLGRAIVRRFLTIIVATAFVLAGVTPVGGFSLLESGKTNSVNRWPYSFGDRFKCDNTGSRWNYDTGYHDRNSRRHPKYWQTRFEYDKKRPLNENEPLQDLVEHLTRHKFHNISPSRYERSCRHGLPARK